MEPQPLDGPTGVDMALVERLMALVQSPQCQQLYANAPDRVFYVDTVSGPQRLGPIGVGEYLQWCRQLVACTDTGQVHTLDESPLAVIEGSFLAPLLAVGGSLHVATSRLTRTFPAITVRKQPTEHVTLEQMCAQQMMSTAMKDFLVLAVKARLNLLISGGSGSGKTTLARALSLHIAPTERICSCEEIDELALCGHLPNVVSMTTYRTFDEHGQVRTEVTLEQLVKEALRMRPDRIWVGETRGKEAYALVKAANSGHDGSLTTVHGDSGAQAVKQLVSYVTESHLSEDGAADQVAKAFHLVVQITKPDPMTRRVEEITELEPVREGSEQRKNQLWVRSDTGWEQTGTASMRMRRAAARYGVDLERFFG